MFIHFSGRPKNWRPPPGRWYSGLRGGPAHLRPAPGAHFFFRPGALASWHEDERFFVYHEGLPVLPPAELALLAAEFGSLKKKDGFALDRGSYLLIFLEKKTGVLRVYRDAWGSHPVYYAADGSCLSSSVGEAAAALGDALDPGAFAEYLCCSYVVGARTLYRRVRALEPMDGLAASRGKVRVFANQSYPEVKSGASRAELAGRLDAIVSRAVADLKAAVADDARVNVSLSGGVDSSLLAAKMADRYPLRRFTCATVDYRDWHLNDTEYYRHVVDRYRLTGRVETVDNVSYAESAAALVRGARYAYHTFSPSFHRMLRTVAAEFPRTAFHVNGTGPDEAMVGFEKLSIAGLTELDRTPRSRWVEKVMSLDYFYTPPEEARRLLRPGAYRDPRAARRALARKLAAGAGSFTEFQRRYTQRTITDHHIRMLHHVAELNGVEIVYPYCTQEFFRFSFGTPFADLNDGAVAKAVNKDVLGRYYEPAFVHRPKIGFHAPSRGYFRSPDGMGKLQAGLDLDALGPVFRVDRLREAVRLRLTDPKAPMDYLLWTSTNLALLMNEVPARRTRR